MKPIIKPVDTKLIENELTNCCFARNTNYLGNEIYIVSAEEAPNTMNEIGRLREFTFRQAGGGTGKEVDIDKYDLGNNGFKQLIVWDPEIKTIIGGYRFALGSDLPKDINGRAISPTAHLFELSDNFIEKWLPKTIELGRSFVQPVYQSTGDSKKSIFALDNLWDGLGLLIIDNPTIENFFGKITMYTHYPIHARNAILYFMKTFFPDNDNLIKPRKPLLFKSDDTLFRTLFIGNNLEENYKILNSIVRKENTGIPPLVNAYMKLSPTMKSFGTAINENFGNVEETGILIKISDIYKSKKQRYISNINRDYRLTNHED